MNMDKDYPAFFERTSFETRVAFTKKQYFMPIPYDDLPSYPVTGTKLRMVIRYSNNNA